MTAHPSRMDFGPITLVSPDGSNRIPAHLWPELEVAVMLEPEPEMRADWVRELELKLGVTDAHRRALIRQVQEARGLRRSMAGKVELPDHERGRSADDLRRLDKLTARLARTDLSPKQRKAAEDEREGLIAAPKARADQAWQDAAIDETAALAATRGETVVRPTSGAVRIDRCPLLRLLRAGHLTAEQFDTAMDVRDLYDARSEDVGSQLGSVTSAGGGHHNDRFVFARLQRAKALQRLGTIERRIALECRDEPACLQMLRGVVGERVSLSGFGEGRALERNAKALRRALDVAQNAKA